NRLSRTSWNASDRCDRSPGSQNPGKVTRVRAALPSRTVRPVAHRSTTRIVAHCVSAYSGEVRFGIAPNSRTPQIGVLYGTVVTPRSALPRQAYRDHRSCRGTAYGGPVSLFVAPGGFA